MALIAIAADKGSPGVTTTALALAAVWPRPVLLAECDPAGGDLLYRLPSADGGPLDPRRGLLTLAVSARHGLQPSQLWEHTQKLRGGLDVLTGVINAEQGAGLNPLWRPVGEMLAALPQADVIADCGRLGADGPPYDLLAEAAMVLLITKPSTGDVVRLRDRVAAIAAAADRRGRRGFGAYVVVVTDQRKVKSTLAEVGHALAQGGVPARVAGGLADDPKGAESLRGEWGGRLDKTLLIRSARDIARLLAGSLPDTPEPGGYGLMPGSPQPQPQPPQQPAPPQPVFRPRTGVQPAQRQPGGAGRHSAPSAPWSSGSTEQPDWPSGTAVQSNGQRGG